MNWIQLGRLYILPADQENHLIDPKFHQVDLDNHKNYSEVGIRRYHYHMVLDLNRKQFFLLRNSENFKRIKFRKKNFLNFFLNFDLYKPIKIQKLLLSERWGSFVAPSGSTLLAAATRWQGCLWLLPIITWEGSWRQFDFFFLNFDLYKFIKIQKLKIQNFSRHWKDARWSSKLSPLAPSSEDITSKRAAGV